MRKVFVVASVAALVAAVAGCSRAKASSDGEGAGKGSTTSPEQTTAAAASAGHAGGVSGDGATGKAYGEHCVVDTECAGAVCFRKRIKSPDAGHERPGANDALEHEGYCSMKCEDDNECPVPPTRGKCGARGMCK